MVGLHRIKRNLPRNYPREIFLLDIWWNKKLFLPLWCGDDPP
nr:MAG TPA: hypothetical protein [Bacteriophage sp.]